MSALRLNYGGRSAGERELAAVEAFVLAELGPEAEVIFEHDGWWATVLDEEDEQTTYAVQPAEGGYVLERV